MMCVQETEEFITIETPFVVLKTFQGPLFSRRHFLLMTGIPKCGELFPSAAALFRLLVFQILRNAPKFTKI